MHCWVRGQEAMGGVLWGRSFLSLEAAAPPSWPLSVLVASQGGEVQTAEGRGLGVGVSFERTGARVVQGITCPGAVYSAFLDTDPAVGHQLGAVPSVSFPQLCRQAQEKLLEPSLEAALRFGSFLLP